MELDIMDVRDIRKFEYVIKERTTLKQKRDILKIDYGFELYMYLIGAYNCYAITHSKEHLSLITNPEALFRSPEADEKFIIELKNYIRDVVGIKREEVKYGTNNSNRTKQETAKNK